MTCIKNLPLTWGKSLHCTYTVHFSFEYSSLIGVLVLIVYSFNSDDVGEWGNGDRVKARHSPNPKMFFFGT